MSTISPIDRKSVYRPGSARLVAVEMRKMVDTRAGFWLLLAIAAISVLLVVVSIFTGPDQGRDLQSFFQVTQIPTSSLLPVLGILMATGEWSQRTAMVTFSLVPGRLTVTAAKFGAAVVYAVLAVVVSLLAAAAGHGFALLAGRTGQADFGLDPLVLAGTVLFQVTILSIGVAFGTLFMNSPVAIVLYLILPNVLGLLGGVVSWLEEPVSWLVLVPNIGPLVDASMTGETWARYGTVVAAWLLLPALLGMVRLRRREIS